MPRLRGPRSSALRAVVAAIALAAAAASEAGPPGSPRWRRPTCPSTPRRPPARGLRRRTRSIGSLERVAGTADPGATSVAELDERVADAGLELTYADDIEPWLGSRAAIFVSSFERGDTAGDPGHRDRGRGRRRRLRTVRRRRDRPGEPAGADLRGHRLLRGQGGLAVGVVDDALVFGTETAFKVAIDASHGESLADSDEYTERLDRSPTIRWPRSSPTRGGDRGDRSRRPLRPRTCTCSSRCSPGRSQQPIAATLTVTADSASFDFAAMFDGTDGITEESPTLADLPADAWFAAALPGLGPVLSRTFDGLR